MRTSTAFGLVIIAVAIAIGAFRDFVFVNLNYQLDFLEHTRRVSYAHSLFRAWAEGMDATGLRVAKWVLAGCFIVVNLLLAVILARVRFGDHRYRGPIVAGFVFVAILAGIAHSLGAWAPVLDVVGVKLLHTLQYPVVLLLIWVAGWLVPRRDGASGLP